MSYVNVHNPVAGIDTSKPPYHAPTPEGIGERATDYAKGVILARGEVRSDYGYVQFPVPGLTKTNCLHGIVMMIKQFKKLDGSTHTLALTTTNGYHYNTSTSTWDCVTRGTLVDNAESLWSTSSGKTVTAVGNAQIDTAQSKFGGASGLFDGTGDYLTVPDSNDFDLSGGIWTIDCWIRVNSLAADIGLFEQRTDANNLIRGYIVSDGRIAMRIDSGGSAVVTLTSAVSTITTDSWIHVAFVENGDSYALYVNGVSVATSTDTDRAANYTGTFDVGRTQAIAGTFNGWIDEFRVVKGTAVWTADFTPSTSAYDATTATGTVLLLHMDGADASTTFIDSSVIDISNSSTIKLKGTYSSKTSINASYTTGIASYFNFSSADLTGNTALHFWIYSSIALSASDYSIRLSEQNAGGAGATYVDFAIPAITASQWTPCCVDGDFTNLNAVLSVSVIVNVDKGAGNLYIDDIRAVTRFTGDADNRFSVTQYNNTDIITNGVDQPQKYDGVVATGFQNLTTTLNAGSITTSEIVIIMKDHVIFMNNTENGSYTPQRVTWGNVGQLQDLVGGTSGYQDLVDDADWIVSAMPLTEDTVTIYKENSIVEMRWIGGQTPFRFTTVYQGDGSAGKECVFNVLGDHAVIGNRYLYTYTKDRTVTQIDEKINTAFYNSINNLYINRSFVVFDKAVGQLQFWIPTSATIPDDIWTLNSVDSEHPWFRSSRSMAGYGFTTTQNTPTIGDLVGNIGDQNYRIGDLISLSNFYFLLFGDDNGRVYQSSTSTYNNNGLAVTNEFHTPDFLPSADPTQYPGKGQLPGQGSLSDFMRIGKLVFEAKGDSITTEYSEDGGSTWSPTQGNATNVTTLTSSYNVYTQDFDKIVRKIRFRFINSTVSSGYFLRYYGFEFKPRSTRR